MEITAECPVHCGKEMNDKHSTLARHPPCNWRLIRKNDSEGLNSEDTKRNTSWKIHVDKMNHIANSSVSAKNKNPIKPCHAQQTNKYDTAEEPI